MTWTSHGHHIDGTIMTGPRPKNFVRCGGPGMCGLCSREALAYQELPGGNGMDSIEMSRVEVKAQLYRVFAELLAQIDAISDEARNNRIDPFRLRTPQGDFVLAPMIAAKGVVLASIAALG